jgi:hypothetical protein
MRAKQCWRDSSDVLCAQILVEIDLFCWACERGWQLAIFNEDEGEGEMIIALNPVETVTQEDAKLGLGTPPVPQEP